MKRPAFMTTGAMALLIGMAVGSLSAQQPPAPAGPQPFTVGNRLGMPINPAPDGAFTPMSSNVKVYGAIYSAESCSYDAGRGVIVVPNRGVGQNVQTNNAWISFINHDGSVHTARWVGIQNPGDQRSNMTTPLVLNEPFGSDIANGILYLADRDGGTNPNDPVVAVIRRFNMQTGAPAGETRVEKSNGFNDLEVADDGTVYATQTGVGGQTPDPTTWQVWKITKDGTASIFVQGAPLRQPNGVALDEKGNIVVVNIGNNEVLTFSPGRQAAEDRDRGAGGQRWPRDHAGRHEVRQQRHARRRLAHSPGPAGGAHRAEHPERGVDVLRRRRESARHPDERQQRDGLHPAQITSTPKLQLPTPRTIASWGVGILGVGNWELGVGSLRYSVSERQ